MLNRTPPFLSARTPSRLFKRTPTLLLVAALLLASGCGGSSTNSVSSNSSSSTSGAGAPEGSGALTAGVDSRNQRAARNLARARQGFQTVDATDTRMEAVPIRVGSQRLGTVVVAASLTPYESTASFALLGSIILGLLMLAAIAGLSRWLISRALRPVARMTAAAADWGEHDLSRRFFPGEPYDELSTLASVFDGLLARLAQGLRREQHLTAEISHELRTPLAKILAEAELSSGRERPAQQYRAALELIRRYAQDLQREPGFRGTAPPTDTHTGAGLGLPLVRRLARAVGGDVEALTSGGGGRFAVRLPAR